MSSVSFTGQAMAEGHSCFGGRTFPSISSLSFGLNRPRQEGWESWCERCWETLSELWEAQFVPGRNKTDTIFQATSLTSKYFLVIRAGKRTCFTCSSPAGHTTTTANCHRSNFFITHWLCDYIYVLQLGNIEILWPLWPLSDHVPPHNRNQNWSSHTPLKAVLFG